MTEKITTRMKQIVKMMREFSARIEEDRENEQSAYHLRARKDDAGNYLHPCKSEYPASIRCTLSEVSERVLRNLESAGLVENQGVGRYDGRCWSDPAEVFDLPERSSWYDDQRRYLEMLANYDSPDAENETP